MTSKFLLSLIFIFSVSQLIYSQDLIIKNDKAELRSKVLEITVQTVKYKNWDHLEGPTYELNKSEVFMIIYANGKRETFSTPSTQPTMSSEVISQSIVAKEQSEKSIEKNTIDQNSKVKYNTSRIYTSLETPLSLGIASEFRIIKNILNGGIDVMYIFYDDFNINSAGAVGLYCSVYAPLNRLLGKYQKQDKGLFVFGHAGYSLGYVDTEYESLYDHSFVWRIGADYFFSESFGVNLFSAEFKSFYAGVSLKF